MRPCYIGQREKVCLTSHYNIVSTIFPEGGVAYKSNVIKLNQYIPPVFKLRPHTIDAALVALALGVYIWLMTMGNANLNVQVKLDIGRGGFNDRHVHTKDDSSQFAVRQSY